jgi:hypothetical protein
MEEPGPQAPAVLVTDAAMNLQDHGIQPLAVSFTGPAVEASKSYISGSIQPLSSWCCGHQ